MNTKKCVLAAILVATVGAAHAQQTWKVTGGTASMNFNSHRMDAFGLRLNSVKSTAVGSFMEDPVGFAVDSAKTDISFGTVQSLFHHVNSGSIKLKGGFTMSTASGATLNFTDMQVIPLASAPDGGWKLVGTVTGSNGKSCSFVTSAFQVNFDSVNKKIELMGADYKISKEMATMLRMPEANSEWIGSFSFVLDVAWVGGLTNDPLPVPSGQGGGGSRAGIYDVSISALSSLSSAGRGTTAYPNGVSGLTMSTTSCNSGTVTIPWQTSGFSFDSVLQPNHPVICMNVYRMVGTKFEQIGEGYLKHGWYATNASSCATGTCGTPGGYALGANCTDTYGTGNNSDRTQLGPRNEVNPYTGVWTPEGSWFANGGMDRVRRMNGTQKRDPVTGVVSSLNLTGEQNRLQVRDQDLLAGGSLRYEAYYITADDYNKYNNLCYRVATAAWSGTTWNFTTTGSLVQGPAIYSWTGSTNTIATPRTEGDVIVAVYVTNLGNGRYNYDYAVFNLDMDRQIDGFTIPVDNALNVTNVQFRDIDTNAANDWTYTHTGDKLTFSMPTSPTNAIYYGRTYNFRLEVNAAATPGTLKLDPFKAGSNPNFSATLSVPTPVAETISGTANLGTYSGGAINMTARLTPVGGGTASNIPVTVNPNGTFSFQTTLRGNYDLALSGGTFLRRGPAGSLNLTSLGVSGVSITMVNGDVNSDGEIGSTDFDALVANFGNSGVGDVDGDGEVGSTDFDIVVANFGESDIP